MKADSHLEPAFYFSKKLEEGRSEIRFGVCLKNICILCDLWEKKNLDFNTKFYYIISYYFKGAKV